MSDETTPTSHVVIMIRESNELSTLCEGDVEHGEFKQGNDGRWFHAAVDVVDSPGRPKFEATVDGSLAIAREAATTERLTLWHVMVRHPHL